MTFQPPKGTRDFLPAESARRRFYFEKVRAVLEKYRSGEIITPAFATLDLLESKGALGGAAVKDIFRIMDKGADKLGFGLIYAGPTPVPRIVASDKSIAKPVKWYYIRPMWRYEDVRPGRYREFWQAGAEFIGSSDPASDAEIITLTYDSVKAMGIKDFYMRINSRRIMDLLAKLSGVPPSKTMEVFNVVDKLEKIGEPEVKGELERLGLSKDSITRLISYVDPKNFLITKRFLETNEETKREYQELEEIVNKAKLMGAGGLRIDFSIVRGLEYYTGMIFETMVSGEEKLGSIASGGRYDKLMELSGVEATPAVGVGIGIDRMVILSPDTGTYSPARVFVAPVNDEVRSKCIEIVRELRKAGIPADMDYMRRNLGKIFNYCSSQKIPFVVVVGPNELKENSVVLRNMFNGKEKIVKISELAEEILMQN